MRNVFIRVRLNRINQIMFRITVLYFVFSGLLTIFFGEILPVKTSIGTIAFVSGSLLTTSFALAIRLFLVQYHKKTLRVHFQSESHFAVSLPFRELCSDILIWIFLGSLLGILTGGYWWTNWKASLQLLGSSLMVGLMVGIFNFLQMEKYLILFCKERGGIPGTGTSRIKISIAAKITLLLWSIIAVAAVFVGFMVFDEISDMISSCAVFGIVKGDHLGS